MDSWNLTYWDFCFIIFKSKTSVKIFFGDYNTESNAEDGEFSTTGTISTVTDKGACIIKAGVNLGWFSN